VDDRTRTAAEAVASDHPRLGADHLIDALESAAFGERVQSFERRGEPLGTSAVTETLRERAVETDTTAETVAEAFVAELAAAFAGEPVVWRRVALESVRRTGDGVEALSDGIDSLRVDPATTVEHTAAAAATAADQGFEWLTAADFETGHTDDGSCWRRGFGLPEVRDGYPLERERPLADGGRRRLGEELLDALDSRGGAVLLGPAGSGKTTTTRAAMSAWERQTDDGTVLYRTGGGVGGRFDPGELGDTVEAARADGPVLVAVEEAVRHDTVPVFDVVEAYADDPNVQFLLNSRARRWDADETPATVGVASGRVRETLAGRRELLTPIRMPPVDTREIERFVANYGRVTGDTPAVAGDETAVHEQIHGRGVSPMSLLAYQVPAGDRAGGDDDQPAFVTHVSWTFETIHDEPESRERLADTEREATLLRRVALAVNVVNAAEMPVRTELLLALADDATERETILELCSRLRGSLLFERGDHAFDTNHPLWSRVYLSHHLERQTAATDEFETVVNDLLALFDDGDLRDGVRETLGEDTELLGRVEREPAETAREFAASLFGVGERQPELQPLYGTSVSSGIELSEVGGTRAVVAAAFARSRMFGASGDPDYQLDEAEWARKRATAAAIDSGPVGVTYHTRRGDHAMQREELQDARDHYRRARTVAASDGAVHATILGKLGEVARRLGEHERARDRHEERLARFREMGDRAGEANSLDSLGAVARERDDYETAERHHREALAIDDDIGDRARVAARQFEIGVDAQRQGEPERALEWFRRSRRTHEDLGADREALDSLERTADVATELQEFEVARRACADALTLIEESGRAFGDRAREFRVRDARLDVTPDGTLRLYYHALVYADDGEFTTAAGLLRAAWQRRTVHDG
ncbi:MAG: hypothetical protein J07HB67_02738, partial [halophilic archaeon J07HB67]